MLRGNNAELGSPLRRLLEVGVLCYTADSQDGEKRGVGDPMELALLRLGQLVKIDREALLVAWPERHQIAFDTETKMMATAHDRERRSVRRGEGSAGGRACRFNRDR